MEMEYEIWYRNEYFILMINQLWTSKSWQGGLYSKIKNQNLISRETYPNVDSHNTKF